MKETILDRFRRWSTRTHYCEEKREPWWVIWLVAIVCGIVGFVLLTSCASTPCDPIVIEKPVTVYVPITTPPEPLTLPLAPERPNCLGLSTQIIKCIADYIQALRDHITELRDEIEAHNSAI